MVIMAEKTRRGFAGMSPEKQREIASKGGKAAHAKGTAHHFTPEEARVAGRKGGQAAHAKGTAHEFTPEEAREAGRKGGLRSQTRGGGGATPEGADPEQTTPGAATSPAQQPLREARSPEPAMAGGAL
jgi:general stress protein YciG